jgi:hypothetical protein
MLEKILSSLCACSNPKEKKHDKTIKLYDSSKTISNEEFKTLTVNIENKINDINLSTKNIKRKDNSKNSFLYNNNYLNLSSNNKNGFGKMFFFRNHSSQINTKKNNINKKQLKLQYIEEGKHFEKFIENVDNIISENMKKKTISESDDISEKEM